MPSEAKQLAWRAALLAACAALCGGCAALPFVPSLLGGLGAASPAAVQVGTDVELSQANFCTVRSDVIGESRGLKVLIFFTLDPTSHVEAFSDLHRKAALDPARPQVLANIVHEFTARNFLLFALTRVTVRADVIDFLEPGQTCPQAVAPPP